MISFLKSAVKNLVAASNVQQVNKNTIAGLHQAAIGMAACCRPWAQLTGSAVGMLRGKFLSRAHPFLVARIHLFHDF